MFATLKASSIVRDGERHPQGGRSPSVGNTAKGHGNDGGGGGRMIVPRTGKRRKKALSTVDAICLLSAISRIATAGDDQATVIHEACMHPHVVNACRPSVVALKARLLEPNDCLHENPYGEGREVKVKHGEALLGGVWFGIDHPHCRCVGFVGEILGIVRDGEIAVLDERDQSIVAKIHGGL